MFYQFQRKKSFTSINLVNVMYVIFCKNILKNNYLSLPVKQSFIPILKKCIYYESLFCFAKNCEIFYAFSNTLY